MQDQQLERYARNLLLRDLGAEGQTRLLKSHLLIIGAGGLGAPCALYLAASGVGTLTIADADQVDLSNLQRQVIHTTAGIGLNKSLSAEKALHAINPEVNCLPIPHRLEGAMLSEAITMADLVIDCSDNFATRYQVNAQCVALNRRLVSGSVIGWEGQVAAFKGYAQEHACYRCLYPPTEAMSAAPRCNDTGVLGPAAGVIGSLQAAEAIRLLAEVDESNLDRVTMVDLRHWRFHTIGYRPDPDCPVCGEK
uniref:Molybdopterin-synthase adenylyltransferase n=1 Tax=Magnetococcus massalia (strain MO-1) TaxID=451514 RepID=A0A1S7LJH4_MAGMO|nr:molybdopterin synthase sulfurylase [Candidatus Magnetococcus massalia]